jgi:hypothetical protein
MFLSLLTLTPKGRDENGPTHTLGDWVRHHDHYEDGGHVTPFARYVLWSLDSSSNCRAERGNRL